MTEHADVQSVRDRANRYIGRSILAGGVVWSGGIGHRFLSCDDCHGVDCYRCGMHVEPSAIAGEYAIPDCGGPETIGHHWLGSAREDATIECAYGDATEPKGWGHPVSCVRS